MTQHTGDLAGRRRPCLDWGYCDICGGVGNDWNIDFWCSTCKGGGTIPTRLFHYQVVSPEMTSWGLYEPPEPFHCFDIYLARTAKEALVMAVKAPEFKDWVRDARADGVPPFKGLKVSRTLCAHGVCFACEADQVEEHPCGFSCEECDKEALEWDRQDASL